MNIANWISVAGILVSLGIATWSAHQTKVAAQLASRPYISIYYEAIDVTFTSKYIAIKNFGKSSAIIENIQFVKLDSDNNYSKEIKNAFLQLIGGSIAPFQKFATAIPDDYKSPITVFISYKDLKGKRYSETFILKTDMTGKFHRITYTKSSDTPVATAIRNSAASIIKNLK